MKLTCTSCGQEIPSEDINVSTDLAYCRVCDREYSVASSRMLSEVNPKELEKFVLKHLSRDNQNQLEFRGTGWGLIVLALFSTIWTGGWIAIFHYLAVREGKLKFGLALFGAIFLLGTIILVGYNFFWWFQKTRILIEHGRFVYAITMGPFVLRRKEIPVTSRSLATLTVSDHYSDYENNEKKRQLHIKTDGETLECGAETLAEKEMELVLTWVQMKMASQTS